MPTIFEPQKAKLPSQSTISGDLPYVRNNSPGGWDGGPSSFSQNTYTADSSPSPDSPNSVSFCDVFPDLHSAFGNSLALENVEGARRTELKRYGCLVDHLASPLPCFFLLVWPVPPSAAAAPLTEEASEPASDGVRNYLRCTWDWTRTSRTGSQERDEGWTSLLPQPSMMITKTHNEPSYFFPS